MAVASGDEQVAILYFQSSWESFGRQEKLTEALAQFMLR
jgi:hypothetical protein